MNARGIPDKISLKAAIVKILYFSRDEGAERFQNNYINNLESFANLACLFLVMQELLYNRPVRGQFAGAARPLG
jgi:hypothetical protein